MLAVGMHINENSGRKWISSRTTISDTVHSLHQPPSLLLAFGSFILLLLSFFNTQSFLIVSQRNFALRIQDFPSLEICMLEIQLHQTSKSCNLIRQQHQKGGIHQLRIHTYKGTNVYEEERVYDF